MTKVIIIGAGGHAAEIDEYIKYCREKAGNKTLNVVGFLDDNPEGYSRYKFSAPFLGGIKDHSVIAEYKYIIGIANTEYRYLLVNQLLSRGASFVSFIHCSAYISESAKIGEGSIIGPNASIGPNVQVGNYTLINSRCSLGHDTIVGDYNFISPNVCFSGFTKVGNRNLFGINSATIPGVKIGDRNKIAAGMILDNNINDDTIVFYRFKERVLALPKQ